MIHEIYPHKYDNSYKDISPLVGDILLCFKENLILMKRSYNFITLPLFEKIIPARHVFNIDDKRYFVVDIEDLYSLDESYEWVSINTLRSLENPLDAYAGICGKHYNYFISHAKYCGCCGEKMVPSKIEFANVCPRCSNTKYPDIMPAIAVAIIDGDEIILTKYSNRQQSFYALVAGYTEIGETLEECVKREAMEEVGLELYDVKYYSSQPWGFSNTIMIGFTAKSYNKNIKMDPNELSEAKWVKREDIADMINPSSMSHKMIMDFKNNIIK